MTTHTYTISDDLHTETGDRLFYAACICGWRSRGWLELTSADDEALLHGAHHWAQEGKS